MKKSISTAILFCLLTSLSTAQTLESTADATVGKWNIHLEKPGAVGAVGGEDAYNWLFVKGEERRTALLLANTGGDDWFVVFVLATAIDKSKVAKTRALVQLKFDVGSWINAWADVTDGGKLANLQENGKALMFKKLPETHVLRIRYPINKTEQRIIEFDTRQYDSAFDTLNKSMLPKTELGR